MLRASATQTTTPLELAAVVDDARDPRVAWGVELRDLASALARRDGLAAAREALLAVAGPEATAAAVGVCAAFMMMNRLVDAAGLPLPDQADDTAQALGFRP